MARRIIILDRIGEPSDFSFKFAVWANVPTERQPYYANAEATSEVKNITAEELTAIQNGEISEQIFTAVFPSGTELTTIKDYLIAEAIKYQTLINTKNPWQYYGTYYDGDSWTAGGVA